MVDAVFDDPVQEQGYDPADLRQPTEQDLRRLAQLAADLEAADAEVARLEEATKAAAKIRDQLAFSELPLLMAEVGMEKFTTSAGLDIKIQRVFNASIAEEKRPEAYKWLLDNNHGGILKAVVAVGFAAGDKKAADALTAELTAKYGSKAAVEEKLSVHSSTLTSWVRKQIEGRKEFPRELFGAKELRKAKVER